MQQKPSRAIFWIYFLLFYIILQFAWWTFQLISLSQQVYENDASRRIVMIIGEGSVFLVLLLVGHYYLRKSIRKEISLKQQKENFLLSVTHELKTPVASSKLILQTLQTRELPHEKQKDLLVKAVADVNRLNSLVDNILTASQIENDGLQMHMEKQNLSNFLSIWYDGYKHQRDAERIVLRLEQNVSAHFDANAMYSVLNNVVENALKYSDDEVLVHLDKNGILEVLDKGDGIEDPEGAKKMFFREGNENTRKAKGTGLGLFIVNQTLLAMGASWKIEQHSPKGTRIKIELKQ